MSRRMQRVGETMREVLAELISREVKDPRVGFHTITAVRMTPDLRHADVYLTVLDASASGSTLEGLNSAARFLRGETTRRMNLKWAPEIVFKLDDAPGSGRRIDQLINQAHHVDAEHDLFGASVLLRRYDDVAIACHVFPDGDALGSTLALAQGLRSMGKSVVAGWATDEVRFPSHYGFLPGIDLLVGAAEFKGLDPAATAFVSLDCAAPDRLGELEELFTSASCLLNVDHHVTNPRFGTNNLVLAEASSTSEIVVSLLDALSIDIDEAMATALYTGISTDTGRLTYPVTSPDTIRIAARLVEAGARPSQIAQEIWETKSVGYLKVLGIALGRLELRKGFVVTWVDQADVTANGMLMDDTEEIIDVVRTAFEADVAVVFKQTREGQYKGSLRSRGDVDVAKIAQRLGGGGHRLAAGFTSSHSEIESSIAELAAQL